MIRRTDVLTLRAFFKVDRTAARRVREWIRDALLAFGIHAMREIASFADSVASLVDALRSPADSLTVDLVMASHAIEAHVVAGSGALETRTILSRRA
jgi:hypothetical protein